MLWYKGWLETRVRLWIALGWMGIMLVSVSLRTPSGPKPVLGLALMMGSQAVVTCVWFAGAGIASQGSFQMLKGLHGSTHFTLSLPVSRLHLLAVRAAVGWIEMACVMGTFCCGVWLLAPLLTGQAAAGEMFEYAVTLIACASVPYFLSVFLATFFDDQWRSWATMVACAAIWGLPNLTHVPASTDIFRAIGEGSPLVSHSMPWPVMAFSLALVAILFFAALKIAQAREY